MPIVLKVWARHQLAIILAQAKRTLIDKDLVVIFYFIKEKISSSGL
jgi:hypothetical protein